MSFAIHPLFPSTAYRTIFVDKDELIPAPSENVKRWLSIRDHTFENGRQLRLLITWTSCPDFPTIYEPLANLAEDGTITRCLTGVIQPDINYKMAETPEELMQITRPVSLLNPATNELFQLPYSTMCVSQTLRNMVDDLGVPDDNTPIPIGSNIINGTIFNTLQLFKMLQIMGNPVIGVDTLKNWNHCEVPEIDVEVRIPALDNILKSAATIDETTREAEIAAAVDYPQFKFASGWSDYRALDYWVTAVDFLDIQPLCMYISHAYASKMANI